MSSQISHPDHYGGKSNPYEAIKVIEAHNLGFNEGNAVKYLLRSDHKGSKAVDLGKAAWYCARAQSNAEGIDPNDHLRSRHQQRVIQMMKGFGHKVLEQIGLPDEDTRKLWAGLIMEEALETIEALGFVVWPTNEGSSLYRVEGCGPAWELVAGDGDRHPLTEPNLVEIADGCADLSVVALGALSACGIPDNPLHELVDQNNLDKIGKGHRDPETGKYVKPADHKPPEVGRLLRSLRYPDVELDDEIPGPDVVFDLLSLVADQIPGATPLPSWNRWQGLPTSGELSRWSPLEVEDVVRWATACRRQALHPNVVVEIPSVPEVLAGRVQ